MDAAAAFTRRSPDEVFRDFLGRRSGIVKALTQDASKFYELCHPEKENQCLYGNPDGSWVVDLPAEEVPPELPEPALGINFARNGMEEKDWLSLVAVHSDVWLLSVAFYFAARFLFDKEDRGELFAMINDLPTVYEIVTGTAKKQTKERTPNSNSKPKKSNTKAAARKMEVSKMPPPEEHDSGAEQDGEDEEEQEETLCGACGNNYASDEFWICCDLCEQWFHGKCVKITPARAEHMKQYKCPGCSNKRARASS